MSPQDIDPASYTEGNSINTEGKSSLYKDADSSNTAGEEYENTVDFSDAQNQREKSERDQPVEGTATGKQGVERQKVKNPDAGSLFRNAVFARAKELKAEQEGEKTARTKSSKGDTGSQQEPE